MSDISTTTEDVEKLATTPSSPTLTPIQEQALELAGSSQELVVASGYAGCGKSTVLAAAARKHTAAIVLAPTNKAAAVLRAKGVPAQTIHSFLYTPNEVTKHREKDGKKEYQKDSSGNIINDEYGAPIPIIESQTISFALKEDAGQLGRCLVDECSMLSPQIVTDLRNAFQHVVLFGDKFQLPPVNAKDIFREARTAIELTEVHRTLADNPIMKLVTDLRTERKMPAQWEAVGEELRTCNFNNKRLFETLVEKNVQAICYSNAMRHNLNDRIREVAALPFNRMQAGESLVSLENVRYTVDDKQCIKFYNGEILTLAEDVDDPGSHYKPVRVKFTNGKTHMMWPFFRKGFWDNYEQSNRAVWNNQLLRLRSTGELTYSPAMFDYSAAITAHKAQGSEWGKVAVFHQRASMARTMEPLMQCRWLYTAFTRAKERLLIVNA